MFIKQIKAVAREYQDGFVVIPKGVVTDVQLELEGLSPYVKGVTRARFPDGSRQMAYIVDLQGYEAWLEEEAKDAAVVRKQRQTVSKAAQQVAVMAEKLAVAQDYGSVLEAAAKAVLNRPAPPAIVINKEGKFKDTLAGMPILQLSDLHFEEFVNPAEVRYANHYNIDIAQKRLNTVMGTAADLLLHHSGGAYHDGIIVLVNGDLVSGEIHDELTRTNSASLQETIFVLANLLYNNFLQYANVFPKVKVIFTPGNHGRMDEKWTAKGAAERSWDMLVGRVIQSMLKANTKVQNIELILAEGADYAFDVYGNRCLVEHGNCIKTTGDAIAGFITSAVRRKLKLHEREANIGRIKGDVTRGVDYLFIGHFHSLEVFRGVIANGSLIGTGEYSMQGAFRPEPPQQVLVNIHPHYGMNQFWAVQAEPSVAIKDAEPFKAIV